MQDKILKDLKVAMLAGDKQTVEVLRMVKSALQMAEIDEKGKFDESKQLKVIAKEAKKRRDAAKMYVTGGSQDRADAELAEAKIIDQYLPEQMPVEEIEKIVDQVIEQLGKDNIGAIMGRVMQRVVGQADGAIVSKIVKEKIN